VWHYFEEYMRGSTSIESGTDASSKSTSWFCRRCNAPTIVDSTHDSSAKGTLSFIQVSVQAEVNGVYGNDLHDKVKAPGGNLIAFDAFGNTVSHSECEDGISQGSDRSCRMWSMDAEFMPAIGGKRV
jgi:hypothetical protein